nr:hypothetical protein [uncultured Methanoregula sp.]
MGNVSPGATISARYFYGDGCSHCENVKPVLAALQDKYPDFHVEMLEIYTNVSNQQNFSAAAQKFNLGNAGIPLIIIGNRALLGDIEIREHLEECILAERTRLSASDGTESLLPQSFIPDGQAGMTSLTLPVVVLSALVDSINPCAFAILVFLLLSLAAAGDRRRILLVGSSYIAAIFSFHLLLGIGLFSAIAFSGFSRIFSLVGAAIAIVLGLVTLLDVLRNRETFLLSVPESRKGIIGRYIQKMSVPAAFILGILAGLFGFSCTGGIYISILGLMGRSLTLLAGLPYLVLYNVIFILPLALVVLLAGYGFSPERLDNWRTGNKRLLRMLIGLAMLAIGLVIVAGWLG